MADGTDRRLHGSASPYEVEVGFSRAVRVGDRILVAGTAPIEADGESVAEDIEGQARRCLAIVSEALEALGGGVADVVRTRTYLAAAEDWEAVARVHGEVFGATRPVATMLVVRGLLDPRWRLEMEVEAVVGAGAARSEPSAPEPAPSDEQEEPPQLRIEPIRDADREYVRGRTIELWSDEAVVTRGALHRPAELPGLIAWEGDTPVGHAAVRFDRDECELVALESESPGRGLGSALVARVERMARYAGVRRLWVITTNDNLEALAFYRRLGFVIAAVHVDGIVESRRLKPSIPATGNHGIPIRDEIELEKLLGETP